MRNFPDFITTVADEFFQHMAVPPRFSLWSAIAIISGALECKTWIRTRKGELYPHLYIILCGPAGVGKSLPVGEAARFWSGLPKNFMAPTDMSKAAIIDALNEAECEVRVKDEVPSIRNYNTLKIAGEELSNLIPVYDPGMLSVLQTVYDSKPFVERKRGSNLLIEIPRPQFILFAGTVPRQLGGAIPAAAWDNGFMSRAILVYEQQGPIVSLFSEDEGNDLVLRGKIAADLRDIHNIAGRMKFEADALTYMDKWHTSGPFGGEPVPTHPKLESARTRRSTNILKLCMVSSASRGNSRIITIADVKRAIDWLLDYEAAAPGAFGEMTGNGDKLNFRTVYHEVFDAWLANGKKPVPERVVLSAISNVVQSHAIRRFYEQMVDIGYFKESHEKNIGRTVIPASPVELDKIVKRRVK